jgi:phage tail-like protein
VSFQSYLDKSLYPSGMSVKVGKVATPPGLPPSVSVGSVPTPGGLPPSVSVGSVPTPPASSGGASGQPDIEPQISTMIFEVTIDGHDLGRWSKVDGLAVKFEIAEYRAGDGDNYRWIEPSYTTYQNVRLGRTTTLKHTKMIMKWLESTSFNSKKVTASIKGYPFWHNKRDESHAVQWSLTGVLPVAWSGPQFDSQTGQVAIETLELAHEGFLPADK